ncbi:MAG TPA: DUF3105 domain-containing protein [Acidimicrobiia bacterium]|nr:DUF3105 domain-containing protein [Acidimicrobiia bacterium]
MGSVLLALVLAACAQPAARTYEVSQPEDLGVEHLSPESVDAIVAGSEDPPLYSSVPATSGPHAPSATPCGVFRQEVPEIFNIHSLEHGAVIFYYQPRSLSDDDLSQLEDLGRELATHVIVMPYLALEVPMAMVAWGNLAELESIDLEAARSFWGEFAQRGPESGIPCDFTVDEAV